MTAAAQPSTVDPLEIKIRNDALDEQLKAKKLVTKDVLGDGNCFFRACSASLYGHQENHLVLRKAVAFYISDLAKCATKAERNDFEKLASIVNTEGKWIGEDVILMTARYLQRPVYVYISTVQSSPLIYSPPAVKGVSTLPVMLAFYEPGHYRSVGEDIRARLQNGLLNDNLNSYRPPSNV